MKREAPVGSAGEQHFTGLEIAVVGISCRFPKSESIDHFWNNCQEGRDCISRFSDDILTENGVPQEYFSHENYVNAKGVIHNPLSFDADFFNYNKREAEYLDPQIRKLHECGFEALGSAGIVPSKYTGSIGCYLTASAQLGWQMAAYDECDRDGASLFSTLNLVEKDFAATRLAYKLGLTGPALVVQTACSSSLTAIHLASRALLLGECQTALVAAAALGIPNQQGYLYQEGMIMSPDGACRPFDEHANGTVGGEGIGAVVLQPLKVAQAQGRPIFAVIKGSALNNDGTRKIGYTAPSIDGQIDVVRRALSMAKVEAESISYIETHGTATELGDPIEIKALSQVFSEADTHSIAIGSVKSIIGHLDSAAGMAGFIKTILMLKHRKLCANHYFTAPNPKTKLSSSPFYINTQSQSWESEGVRRAGVSSFGIGGTNAHVILEEYIRQGPDSHHGIKESLKLLPLSAKSAWSLAEMEKRLLSWLEEHSEQLADAAWTLQYGREHFNHRSVLIYSVNQPDAVETKFVRGDYQTSQQVVFLYPGQGSQYQMMGRELYQSEPLFRESLQECLSWMDTEIAGEVQHYLNESDNTTIYSPVVIQLAIFSIEYAVTHLLQSKGIEPDIVLGHSLGEYVAATISGVFTLKDALFLVTRRAELMERMSPGVMLSVSLAESQVAEFIQDSIEVSVVNGVESTVLSGTPDDIDSLEVCLQQQNIHARRLNTTHAFHCATIDEIQDEYAKALGAVTFNAQRIPILSNLTGTWHQDSNICQPDYWLFHQRHKVDFLACLQTLNTYREQGLTFIEVGPGNTLSSFVQKFFRDSQKSSSVIVNMVRHPNSPDNDQMFFYTQLAKLWCYTGLGNWSINESGSLTQLPVYSFAEQEYTKVRDVMANGKRVQNQPSSKRKPILYQPVWYRDSAMLQNSDFSEKAVADSKYLILTSKRSIDFAHRLNGYSVLNDNIILVDDEPNDRLLDRAGSYTFLLVPNEEDFAADPLQHYQRWLLCIRELISIKTLSASRFILLTPQIENVLGNETVYENISLLKGIVQSIPFEHPEHSGHQIDITYQIFEQDLVSQKLLHQLICSKYLPSCLAVRHNQIWLPDFKNITKKKSFASNRLPVLQQGGLVIVTGGTGGVGLQLSQCLVQHYSARVVLLSRTPFPERSKWESIRVAGEQPELIKRIEAMMLLEKSGGKVILRQSDVADRVQLFQVLADIEKENGSIDMVVHSAGSDAGALIMQPDISAHEKIMSAKVTGTLNLLAYFEGRSLQTMVLCSSLLAYSGAAGQSAYVAANAFLDALSERRELSLNICSFAWDRWLDIGMAARNIRAGSSFTGLTSEEGKNAFLQSLGQISQQQRLLIAAEPIEVRQAESAIALLPTANRDSMVSDISLRDAITDVIQHQLGITEVDEQSSFFALGATSLDIVQINEKLKQRLHCEIPISMMFTYSSVSKLHDELFCQSNLQTEQQEIPQMSPKSPASQLAKQRMQRRRRKTI